MTTFNSIHINYTTLYHTYRLLYSKGHIKVTRNNTHVNVEAEKNIGINKMTTLN